jgi:hypothetical protein
MGYKIYLLVSIISIVALLVIKVAKIEFSNKAVLVGVGIGAGLRAVYEYFKEQKQRNNEKIID